MVQHGSTYKILDTLGCLSGEDMDIRTNSDKLSKIRQNLRENLTIAHNKAAKTYNLRSRPVQFQKGQLVFIKNHVMSSMSKCINRKFMPKYTKCRIKDRIGNNLYDIEDQNGKYIGKYHASDIKS